jgi:hypothetical protein
MGTELKIDGKVVYVTKTGFKIGSKGKVTPPSDFLKGIPNKGQRRQLRKFARSNGFNAHAAATCN